MSFNKVDDAPKLTTFGVLPTIPFEIVGLPKFKVVNYCGLPVAVPKGFKWLAIDENGDVFAYKKKPYLDCGNWHVKEKHESDKACKQVADLYYYLDEIPDDLCANSCIRIKDLPRYYP